MHNTASYSRFGDDRPKCCTDALTLMNSLTQHLLEAFSVQTVSQHRHEYSAFKTCDVNGKINTNTNPNKQPLFLITIQS